MFLRTRSSTNKLASVENICPEKLPAKKEKKRNEVKENKGKLLKQTIEDLPKILNKTTLDGKVESEWLQEIPIFVASESKQKPIRCDQFPKRNRDKLCYLCGLKDGILEKCAAANCHTHYHRGCAEKNVAGGYTFEYMKRNEKIYCSLHHCTACFADHNRTRCYNGKLIPCDQCELAWHVDCIPGGCEIAPIKETITCPRHVQFKDMPHLHFRHCADCQQDPEPDEKMINCTKCFRAFHFKCYATTKFSLVKDTKKEREKAICHWCETFDFIRHGEYAMGRLANLKWYPCKVVKNDDYPDKNDSFLGSIGYVCVEWLPYRGKIFHSLLSHNRIVAMAHQDYSFVRDAHKFECFDEWKMAQEHTFLNSHWKRPIKEDQIPNQMMSNGEKMIRKITHNKYSKTGLKTPRDRVYKTDSCKCMSGAKDRCGPSSQCLNRALHMECPKECNDAPNKKCNNRRISDGDNCIKVEIKYFPGKGYGAIALENVPPGGFVGEYVGEIIDAEEKKRRMDRIATLNSHEAQYYLMELDERRTIDAQYYGNDMRYVNHSCNPNCIIEQIQSDFDIHLVLKAKREIKKGEELSFDYNMQGCGRAVPVCHCNEQNCTGILSADSAVKKSMYDWEKENTRPIKNDANIRRSRARSLPPCKINNNRGAVSKFAISAPVKRKAALTKEEGKCSTKVAKKENVKRSKTNHH